MSKRNIHSFTSKRNFTRWCKGEVRKYSLEKTLKYCAFICVHSRPFLLVIWANVTKYIKHYFGYNCCFVYLYAYFHGYSGQITNVGQRLLCSVFQLNNLWFCEDFFIINYSPLLQKTAEAQILIYVYISWFQKAACPRPWKYYKGILYKNRSDFLVQIASCRAI